MREIKRLFFLLVIIVIFLLVIVFLEGYKQGILVTGLIFLIGLYLKDYIKEFKTRLSSVLGQHSWKRSQKELEITHKLSDETLIRISFAYLFRIKIGDKYFLVPNSRTGKFQPVGGAYKFGLHEAKYLVENFSAKNDNRIEVDEITEADYRLLIKNKYLRDFVKRFDNTLDRENIDNLSREFIEEIFKTGILKKDVFGNLIYSYCGRHMTNIEKTAFGMYELLLADIVEVDLTHTQKKLFKSLMDIDSDKYKFFTADEINNLGMDYDSQNLVDIIANHTPKILTENNGQLFKKFKYKYKRNYKSPIIVIL